MRRSSSFSVVAVATGLAVSPLACFDGTPSSAGAVISCLSSADCVAPLTCDPFVARCVAPGSVQDGAPSLVGQPSLTPERGGFDTTFELSFELDGDVAEDPVVAIDVGDEVLRWTVSDASDRVGRRWRYSFSPSSAVPPGRYAVRGAWFGIDQTASGEQALGTLVVEVGGDVVTVADPALLGAATVSPAIGDHSSRFSVTFELNADLDADPEVFSGDVVELPWELDATGSNRQARRWVYGLSPPTSLSDGGHPVRARLTATDGRVVQVSLGTIVIDSLGPLSSVSLEPALIGRTGTARLSVVVSEPLAAPPSIRFRDADPGLELETSTDSLYVFTLTPTCFAGGCIPADGRYPIEAVELADSAGNRTVVRPPDLAITVDARAPRVLAISPDRTRASEVPGFNVVTLDVVVDEVVADADLVVALDDLEFACTRDSAAQNLHRCTGIIDPVRVQEGDRALRASAVDAAGNVGVGSVAIATDFTAPTIVAGSPTLSLIAPSGALPVVGSRARPGVSLEAAFTSDELLAGPPLVEVVPAGTPLEAPAPVPLPVPSSAFLGGRAAEHAVVLTSAVAAGEYAVRATLQDPVGHAVTLDLGLPFSFNAVVESSCPSLGCADIDGDGQIGFSATCPAGIDCDDSNPAVFVGAPEIPGDGVDNGCLGGDDAPVDESTGIFVDPSAPPGGDGSRAAPFQSPQPAEVIFLAKSVGGIGIPISLAALGSDVIVGGFDPQTWTRQPEDRTTIDAFDLRPLRGMFGVDASLNGGELTGSPLLVGDSELNTCRVNGAVMVRSVFARGAYFLHDVRVVEGNLVDTKVRCVDRCTFVRSRVGAVEADPLTDVTVVNSTVLGSSTNFAPVAHISAVSPSGRLIIVGSAIGQAGVAIPPVAWQSDVPVRIINTHIRTNSTSFAELFVNAATLQGVAFDAQSSGRAFSSGGELSGDANDILTNAACVSCADVQIVRGADVVDGVHILPTSPLRALGVNPISASSAAAADFDGDCRVPPFDIGPDQVP